MENSKRPDLEMPSVKVEMNCREMEAITEFARLCGESVPEIMKKIAIREATLADGYGLDDRSYDFAVILPIEGRESTDRTALEVGYNRVRRILGWKEIRL